MNSIDKLPVGLGKWTGLVMVLLGCFLSSCKKDVEEPDYITLTTSDGKDFPTQVSVPEEGATERVAIATNGAWTITVAGETRDWITVTPSKGKGNGESQLVIEPNDGGAREASLQFMVHGKTLARVRVVQAGGAPEVKEITPLLDIVFHEDGTASDNSPNGYEITTFPGSSLTTLYSPTSQRMIARFERPFDGSSFTSGFYKFDYTSDNDFRNKLADGHTMEALFMLDQDQPLPDFEIKMFSSHEAGGTGVMLGSAAQGHAINFLPNINGQYVWTNSRVVPERGTYYHVVGVWDKARGQSRVYVNGELLASVPAAGDLTFPAPNSNWFCIGGDPEGNGTTAQMGWNGDVVISRIYDEPLNEEEVATLWSEVSPFAPSDAEVALSRIHLASGIVERDAGYVINGSGFLNGDQVKIVPVSELGDDYVVDAAVTAEALTLALPSDMTSGSYRFYLNRGAETFDLGFASLMILDDPIAPPKVIAHRGFWKSGAPQNSLAALIAAQQLDIYGTEVDLYITVDGVVVSSHDPVVDGITLEDATFDELQAITLANGEKLPTLEQLLDRAATAKDHKLVLEIKTHTGITDGKTNNDRVVSAALELVKEKGMEDQVEYIAFSLDVCKRIVSIAPDAKVAYLNGDVAPGVLHDAGISGIDYEQSVIRANPDWVLAARELGMTVNVWTVNEQSAIRDMIDRRVDFITTDDPQLAHALVEGQ